MSKLDPRIEVVREKFGLDREDFWELPQKKGTWVAKHAALEVAAVKAGIVFDMPVIVEKDSAGLTTSIIVQGVMDGRTEWSIGETNPSNYRVTGKQPSYPWAMAEKRAKDRVILKLIGIHGLVYSEDEMSDADERPHRQDAPARQQSRHDDEEPAEMSNPAAKAHWKTIYDEMADCTTLKQLQGAWERHQPVVKVLSEEHRKMLMERKNEMKEYLSENAAAAANGQKPVNTYNFDSLAQ